MSKLSKQILDIFYDVEEDLLIRTLFEMNRFYDAKFKDFFAEYKKKYGIILDSFERKILRNYYYYGNEEILRQMNIKEFPKLKIDDKDVKLIDKLTLEKLELKNSKKIITSIYSKIKENNKFSNEKTKADKWLSNYYCNTDYRFICININQNFIDSHRADFFEKLLQIINYSYKHLCNYRHIAIVLEEKIYDNNVDISWEVLSKIAVYMENFKQYKDKFYPFKREKKIEELSSFLSSNKNLTKFNYLNIATEFYNTISTGFSFSDMLVSDDASSKVLIMRKIQLDESPVACPACLEMTGRGNSYPLMFLKSWECQNPNCSERSKSGRGKRYDEYGAFRYFKLVENNLNNVISKQIYNDWRRDIYNHNNDIYKMLMLYYSWNNEKILFINKDYNEVYKSRKIVTLHEKLIQEENYLKYNELPIYRLLESVCKKSKLSNKNIEIKNNIEIVNDDSTKYLSKVKSGIVQAAITSPPYYNAREYSQWPTFIAYLVDMMLNAKSVYRVLSKDGTYLYNVGDIVDTDNVYVSSNMSKRRIMLGFYSVLAFEIVGFNVVGNKIWDKGEVESKRNSTVNLVSGYVKYVNCYEHIWVFNKTGVQICEDNKVYKIKPVYKINCKGRNILGHTAPYPEELVELIKEYVKSDKYILDPFLGSGTTGIWAKKNDLKFIGCELDKNYYNLAKSRINEM